MTAINHERSVLSTTLAVISPVSQPDDVRLGVPLGLAREVHGAPERELHVMRLLLDLGLLCGHEKHPRQSHVSRLGGFKL